MLEMGIRLQGRGSRASETSWLHLRGAQREAESCRARRAVGEMKRQCALPGLYPLESLLGAVLPRTGARGAGSRGTSPVRFGSIWGAGCGELMQPLAAGGDASVLGTPVLSPSG